MDKLKLPQKENKLFNLLQEHAGQVVPKDQIFDIVWQNDTDNASDWALNALIYRLRKNFAFQSSGYTIHNEKNGGYVMYKEEDTISSQLPVNLNSRQKKENYKLSLRKLAAILEEEHHMISKMATINCVLKDIFPYYFWTGFYLVHKGGLVVGPYQGTLGCLRIAFGRGVCGTAAKTLKTQIVPDVNKFPGHISCDCRTKSEIVVPVFNNKNQLIAVFDVDSTQQAAFDTIDKKFLEELFNFQFSKSTLEK